MGRICVEQIAGLTEVLDGLANELKAASQTDMQLRRLRPIPGIGLVTTSSVTADAVAASAPDLAMFNNGRDSGRSFAAWPGAATEVGGRQDQAGLGQQDGSLIVGTMSVIRRVVHKGGSANRWLAALLARKPRMVAAVALANTAARMIRAMTI